MQARDDLVFSKKKSAYHGLVSVWCSLYFDVTQIIYMHVRDYTDIVPLS